MGTSMLWVAEDVTADELAIDGGVPDGGAVTPPASPSGARPDAGGGGDTKWRRIDAKRALRLRGRGPLDTAPAVRAALTVCDRTAKEVQDLAARMSPALAHGDAGSGVGDLAARSVEARGIARAACAVAAVRVALAGSKPDDQARLDASNARWRAPR